MCLIVSATLRRYAPIVTDDVAQSLRVVMRTMHNGRVRPKIGKITGRGLDNKK